MPRPLVPLFLLLSVTTLTGLASGLHRVASCADGSGSLLDHVLCDPDHVVPPAESQVIIHLLTKYGNESGHKVVVFLAANFTTHENVKPTTTTGATIITPSTNKGGGGADGEGSSDMTDINRLKELVVAANNLTTATSSVILLVGIRDQYQMATWWSASLNDVLTTTTGEEARQNASTLLEQQHFPSAVVQVACYLCWKTRVRDAKTLQEIVLTVVWMTSVVMFVSLLVVIVVELVRARHQAMKARAEAGRHGRGRQTTSLQRYPITSASDIQDFSVVSFTSTGQVFLGTTDIVAMPPQDCSSTDNLLQD